MVVHRISQLLFLLAFTFVTSSALGINCRGSSQCSALFININTDHLIPTLSSVLSKGGPPDFPGGPVNPSVIYYSGELIACAENAQWGAGSVCAFMQGNVPAEGVNGSIITQRMKELADHCSDFCGSVPLSGDNDPNKMGELTVNYTYRKGCNGLCPPSNGHDNKDGTAISDAGPVTISTGEGRLEDLNPLRPATGVVGVGGADTVAMRRRRRRRESDVESQVNADEVAGG